MRRIGDNRALISARCRGLLSLCALCVLLCGCSRPVPADSLILVEFPRTANPQFATDQLAARYRVGSRVVLATKLAASIDIRVLSAGLCAAADAVLSCDGRRVVFAGKRAPQDEWQIYEATLPGGSPRRLTSATGGASYPALLGDGSLVFVSPAPPSVGAQLPSTRPSALFVQTPGGQPRQISFSGTDVSNPTVLADGRILFVTSPRTAAQASGGQALYTINNDGTEITAFAGQHDKSITIERPRQLEDGRIVFMSASPDIPNSFNAESVSAARPFASRALILPNVLAEIHSVQPGANEELFVCATLGPGSENCCAASSVFRVRPGAETLGSAFIEHADWDILESIPVGPSHRPMGRISNIDASRKTGQILCLNANDTTLPSDSKTTSSKATRVRIFTEGQPGIVDVLGEVALQPDGSFMAEVPANLPLGFDALDEDGHVLRHEQPLVWLRPGENRACIGCHEPHNHSPRNARPLAVRVPVPKLLGQAAKLASAGSKR